MRHIPKDPGQAVEPLLRIRLCPDRQGGLQELCRQLLPRRVDLHVRMELHGPEGARQGLHHLGP